MSETENRTTETVDRRRALVLAAFRGIASQGFEGLRLRDVAEEAGINHATLHHYFATKEHLVAAVVEETTIRFKVTLSTAGTPADQLRTHLAGLDEMMVRDPQLFRVLQELALRAGRHPAIASMLRERLEAWHADLVALLTRGVELGIWPSGLDVAATASMIVFVVKGASDAPAGQRRHAFSQLERWLGLTSTPDGRTPR